MKYQAWDKRVLTRVTCLNIGIFLRLLLCLLVVLAGGGCSDKQRISSPATIAIQPATGERRSVQEKLIDQYNAWRAVPYRPGGMSRDGIDCSAFVRLTFNSRFGIDLPRTTEELALTGTGLARDKVLPGDLLLFKTGRLDRHVGIVVDDRLFMHVSTRRGVMLSDLSEPYWRDHFWQARRIFK